MGVNPVQKHQKAEKKRFIQRQQKERDRQRDERLAKRNPQRLEQQIGELKQVEANARLNAHDARLLKQLQADLARVHKLQREGKHLVIESDKTRQRDRAHPGPWQPQPAAARRKPKDPSRSVFYDPVYNPLGAPPPGQEYREWSDEESDDSRGDTDEEVRRIPMPPGTPPPLSDDSDDEARTVAEPRIAAALPARELNRDSEPGPSLAQQAPQAPQAPQSPAPAQAVYSAAPVLKDLRKDATRMVPAALRRRAAPSAPHPDDEELASFYKDISQV